MYSTDRNITSYLRNLMHNLLKITMLLSTEDSKLLLNEHNKIKLLSTEDCKLLLDEDNKIKLLSTEDRK